VSSFAHICKYTLPKSMSIVLFEISDFYTIYNLFPDIKSNDCSYQIAVLIWLPMRKIHHACKSLKLSTSWIPHECKAMIIDMCVWPILNFLLGDNFFIPPYFYYTHQCNICNRYFLPRSKSMKRCQPTKHITVRFVQVSGTTTSTMELSYDS